MSALQYELASATNYAQKCHQIFHKQSTSIVSWQSTEYAITPIQILFKLPELTFVTELFMHPKLYKSIKSMQIYVSDNQMAFESIAKIYDFTDGVRVEISKKCKYIKFVVLEKQYGCSASIDFLKVYGHPYLRSLDSMPLHSTKTSKVQQLFIELGLPHEQDWNVDSQTLITLYDMSKLTSSYLEHNSKEFSTLKQDIETVLEIGRQTQKWEHELEWVTAKHNYSKIMEIKGEIQGLKKRREYYDEKYQTTLFDEMVAMDQNSNFHDNIMKGLLEEDRRKLDEERQRKEREAADRQAEIDEEFERLEKDSAWWEQENQLDRIEHDNKPVNVTKSRVTVKKEETSEKDEEHEDFDFKNPYVYNQGDADMERYIKPLLTEFGPGSLGDPEVLRKYEQMEYLDILGARIWVAAHSENWRQRVAATQAVLDLCENELPQRYQNGKTRNLFLALMQFAQINAQDKVLQIYYISLKIMTRALQPPIYGDDVPPVLVNKCIHKFIYILIDKISEMNSRAKQISLKTLITIFSHPAADINIAVSECIKICKPELNVKFVPVQKQNPRIIQSRLQIISSLLTDLHGKKTSKVNFDQVLKYLIEGALFHSHNDVRVLAVDTLQHVHKLYPNGTVQWYKTLQGLKPNISAEIEARLKIK